MSETENSVSMDDTIRQTFEAIQKRNAEPEIEQPAPEVEAEPVAEAKPDRARDESGKFVKQEKAPEKPVEAKAEPEQAEQPQEQPKKGFLPKWRKEALPHWSKLDPTVQAEIEKREQDFHKGIEQYRTGAEAARAWEQAVQPYMATIQGFGVTPQVAAQQLFAADHALRYGTPQQKQAMIYKIARDYGIELTAPQQAGGQPPAQPAMSPEIEAMRRELLQLKGAWTQQQTLAQQQEAQQLNQQVSQFAQGKDYFEALKPTMAALLQAGQADDLESAYELAFSTHPATRPMWLAKQQESWRAEAQAKAEAARKAASTNVKPKGSLPPGAPASGSMEDTIRNTYREIQSRS